MALADRIQEFLQRLTPLTRNCLLTELERLETSEGEMPGTAEILAKLRAEFRKDGSTQNRVNTPSRYFFAPLEPLLVDGAPEHANSGLIQRGSLAAIWEWISRDLLPTMARDYIKQVDQLILSNKPKEAGQVAATFQIKVVKYLENTLGSADGVEQTRKKLASYTASRSAFSDLTKMQSCSRARRPGKVQRRAACGNREFRHGCLRDNGVAGRARKQTPTPLHLRWRWWPVGSRNHGS